LLFGHSAIKLCSEKCSLSPEREQHKGNRGWKMRSKHHYTSKERTGLSAKELKLHKVLAKLNLEITLEDCVNFDKYNIPQDKRIYHLSRERLSELIIQAIDCMDRYAVYNMINYLSAYSFIEKVNRVKFTLNVQKIDETLKLQNCLMGITPLSHTLDSHSGSQKNLPTECSQKENTNKIESNEVPHTLQDEMH
jgi:hypothetical protein